MNIKNTVILLFSFLLFSQYNVSGQTNAPIDRENAELTYLQMQEVLSAGWNTWDTRSVLTHVLLPYGMAVDLNLMDAQGKRGNTFRIGERASDAPTMRPGAHTYDGSYTDISLEWSDLRLRVQSAADGHNNVILITPRSYSNPNGQVIVNLKTIWRKPNQVATDGRSFTLTAEDGTVVSGTVKGSYISTVDNEIRMSAGEPVLICCGTDMTMESAQQLLQSRSSAFLQANQQKYGNHYDVHNAMQTVLAWDNIYDVRLDRVITPVSRSWNVSFNNNSSMGGFILFCWDNYFASMMLSIDNKELAYANAVEITQAAHYTAGFVPNFYMGHNNMSFDRSQPPVGSMAVWNVYQRYKDKWLLELLYEDLLAWNHWWEKNRMVDGLFCWGSTPRNDKVAEGINDNKGASLESGLDNSHMYDNISFDTEKHVQRLNDVGLSSLYVMDCDYLAKIAEELGQSCVVEELTKRSNRYRNNLAMLWDNTNGFYYNRHTDTKQLDARTSPTCFYPLLAKAPTQAQAQRMISEHLLNPAEFWGNWVIPATPRNDPAFADNIYWRGRIWAPLNFLVYLGLRNYNLPEAQTALSEKSKKLLLNSWTNRGYVFENYNATTGVGDDVFNSDKFYHWGALLGFISLIENGYYQYE